MNLLLFALIKKTKQVWVRRIDSANAVPNAGFCFESIDKSNRYGNRQNWGKAIFGNHY